MASAGKAGKSSRVAEVRAKLRQFIVRGEFEPGDKLPTEVALTRDYGVSRTVVREAIAALRAAGLVEVRHGVGVFVCEPVMQSNMFQPVDKERISSTIELLELRTAIEIEAATLAAARRSPAQEEALFEHYDELNAVFKRGADTVDADFAFHLAVADATNNPRFREFLVLWGEQLIPRSVLPENEASGPSKGYIEQMQAEHLAIITAISNRDAAAAGEAMRTHLKGGGDRYRRLIRQEK